MNVVYADPWLQVRQDDVIRPDGHPGTHVVAQMKPGVCILPIDDHGACHLTDEFHYGVGRHSLEAVSGGIEADEDPEITARREMQEELGITAGRLDYLTTVDPFTTIMVSPTRLYLARDLKFGAASPEGTELIRHVRLPLAEAVRQVESGEISHAPTCVLILLAARQAGI